MKHELIFTMDVEDWYHSENVVHYLPEKYPEHSSLYIVEKIMNFLGDRGIKGTFFFLGTVAKDNPSIVLDLFKEGHEIANHGWDHSLLNTMDYAQTHDDIRQSTEVLETIINDKVLGYRSPCFSVNDSIFEILNSFGYRYTSMGIRSTLHDRYSKNSGYRNAIVDLELPVASRFGLNIPATGGGWFRLFPCIMQKLLLGISDQNPKIFYCHPWDFDEFKPALKSMPFSYHFRHTVNTKHSFNKLSQFDFSKNVLKNSI